MIGAFELLVMAMAVLVIVAVIVGLVTLANSAHDLVVAVFHKGPAISDRSDGRRARLAAFRKRVLR